MYNIRLYNKKDYPMICEWWSGHKGSAPAEDMFTEDSTYILENEKGEPWICVSMYFTNCSGFCFLEGTVSNPFISKRGLGKAMKEFNAFFTDLAKDKGFKRIIGLTNYPHMKLFTRMNKDMGYIETLTNASVFVKFL